MGCGASSNQAAGVAGPADANNNSSTNNNNNSNGAGGSHNGGIGGLAAGLLGGAAGGGGGGVGGEALGALLGLVAPGGVPWKEPTPELEAQVGEAIKGQVVMFSGCADAQTSADVFDVGTFGLPTVDPQVPAGGACTNALLSILAKAEATGSAGPAPTYADLLVGLRDTLREKGYAQVPQLSSSRNVQLRKDRFSVLNSENPSGRTRALLIGINYFGQKGELKGCVNDVKMMRHYILAHGFAGGSTNLRCLTDDPKFANARPSAKNIFNQMRWLLEDAAAGDSLFFHFSGHGTQVKEILSAVGGDEADGRDEALVPLDFQKKGFIRDDTIFKMLVKGLPAGVRLTCVFDCCHSGTILDLPFAIRATERAASRMREDAGDGAGGDDAKPAGGRVESLLANPSFRLPFLDMAQGCDFGEVAATLGGMAAEVRGAAASARTSVTSAAGAVDEIADEAE